MKRKNLAALLLLCVSVFGMATAHAEETEPIADLAEAAEALQLRSAEELRMQGNYMPVTGFYQSLREDGNEVLFYIAPGAYTNEFLTVVAAPDTVTTVEEAEAFAYSSGWKEQMDQYGECLLVLPAPENGWGADLEADCAYIAAALPSFRSDSAITVYGCYYMVSYDEAIGSMQLYAAGHPLSISSQVFVNSKAEAAAMSEVLAEAGTAEAGTYDSWEGVLETTTLSEIAVPTWFIGTAEEESVAYWKTAALADDITTAYGDVDAVVQTSENSGQTAADLIDFLNNYVRAESSALYGNSLRTRRVIQETENAQVVDFEWTDPASGYTWNRQYLVYVPDSAAQLYPDGAPVVYCYHGATNSDNLFFNATGWADVADELGYIIVYLNGTVSQSNPSRCMWSTIGEGSESETLIPGEDVPSDIDYVKAVIEQVDASYATAKSSRRYVYGNSAGSMNSNLIAQVDSGLFTALGTTSGPVMGENALVTEDYGPYVWDGVEGSKQAVMAQPDDSVFPVSIILGTYDHWPAAVGFLDKDALAETISEDGKYTALFPGQKYARSQSAEVDYSFFTQLYWTMRNGVTVYEDGTSFKEIAARILDGTLTFAEYEEAYEENFLKNMEVTNPAYYGEPDEDGTYSSDAIGKEGYYTKENVEAGLADETTIDRYTTYTWFNEEGIPVFQWSENSSRAHEMTPDDAWMIAVNWFEHWEMDEEGNRYYDGALLNE